MCSVATATRLAELSAGKHAASLLAGGYLRSTEAWISHFSTEQAPRRALPLEPS
jgi:hypothetical protein